jgi:NAD(P)-dependent dehydrogenase (short-subunit alcohol dehydrogenase family)
MSASSRAAAAKLRVRSPSDGQPPGQVGNRSKRRDQQVVSFVWYDRSDREKPHNGVVAATRAGIAGLAPYGASKGGIDQLVRTLAVEWAPHGIRVNAIAPGYVDNVMAGVEIHSDSATEARIRAFTPMGRRATVDEIAGPIIFLASPAAAYVTGATLMVDGGYSAQ